MRLQTLSALVAAALAWGLGGTPDAAASEVDEILAERDAEVTEAEADFAEEVATAQAELDEITAEADDEAIDQLERLARKATRNGDSAVIVSAWKAVLRIDREHADARAYFSAMGTLDQVLADLDAAEDGADLLGVSEDGGTRAEDGEADAEPLALAMLGSQTQITVLALEEDQQALSDIPSPITKVPPQLERARYIQLASSDRDFLRLSTFREGAVAVVVGPGYGGLDELRKAGFEPQAWTVGVSGADLPVFVADLAQGQRIDIRPGPIMVVVRNARFIPAAMRRR